jgi:hypothetical protein
MQRDEYEALLSEPMLLDRHLAGAASVDPFVLGAAEAGVPRGIIQIGLEMYREYLGQRLGKVGSNAALLGQLNAMLLPMKDDFGVGRAAVLGDKRLPIDQHGQRHIPLKDVVNVTQPSDLYRVLESLMEKSYPWLLRKFYPRCYENTGGYHSPKMAAVFLTNVVAETMRYGYDKSPTAYRLMFLGMRYLIEHQVPMFFIAPDLLKAVQLSDFADDIDWTTMQLPYEHGIFILPRGGYSHPKDGDVSMIMWSRIKKGEAYSFPMLGLPRLESDHDGFATVALCAESGIWYDSCLNGKYRPTLRLRNLFYRTDGEELPKMQHIVDGVDEDLSEEDSGFLEGIGVILFGTLLAMNARPELVERGSMCRVAGKAEKRKEFWSPNIIGKKYKFRREVPRVAKDGAFVFDGRERGTHASPRMHWRRGHFRNQAYGEQRRLRKIIWLEPCLIGAEVE